LTLGAEAAWTVLTMSDPWAEVASPNRTSNTPRSSSFLPSLELSPFCHVSQGRYLLRQRDALAAPGVWQPREAHGALINVELTGEDKHFRKDQAFRPWKRRVGGLGVSAARETLTASTGVPGDAVPPLARRAGCDGIVRKGIRLRFGGFLGKTVRRERDITVLYYKKHMDSELISDACQVSTDCQNSRSLHMDPQNQHGSGSSLVVTQQPALDNRQRLDYEREIQPAAILSLDQIKAIRGSNEYTEGPSVHRPTSHLGHAGLSHSTRGPILSRSTSTGSAASSGSNSSASSEQGLLGRSPPARPVSAHRSERAVRTQPKQLIVDDLKGSLKEDLTQHKFICEQCGKCKCGECTAPRTLPSCLACNRQCLCSAESMVEYGTCMCLVKGIFYHCSNDDEGDSYSDNPCSCSQSHCCSRYLCMGAMSLFLPCLLCYPPAKGCLKLCRGCYDWIHRPGCRCKNSNTVYCKLESCPSRGQGKPS
ncbi:hypothetical protein E2I00_004445, partial [Balaenoptera physalus]